MNFVMIYGPIAAGKLTVAKELSTLTGYKLLDNHTVFNAITPLFPFDDPKLNRIRSQLGKHFRLTLFEEAAKANISFIATMIIRNEESIDFLRTAIRKIDSQGGNIYLVQLLPTTEAIMHRVEQPSRRMAGKVATRDLLADRFAEQPLRFEKFPDTNHLTVDNTDLPAAHCARQIMEHYHLNPVVAK